MTARLFALLPKVTAAVAVVVVLGLLVILGALTS